MFLTLNSVQKIWQRLRFPEFKNAPAWEQRKVGEIFTVTRGQVLSAMKVSEYKTADNIYPVYSSQTKNDGLMGYFNEYLFDTAITWTTDGANAGTVNFREGKFFSTNVNGVLLSNDGLANKAVSEIINKVAWKHVSKVGNPKLMNNVMSEIRIMIPTLAEQKAIGDFFQTLDRSIALHQRELENLKNRKKSLLQKMFPKNGENVPEIRFLEFKTAPAWEQRKLGEVAEIVGGGTPSTSNPEYWDGDIDWYAPAEIGEKTFVSESKRKISKLGLEKSSAKLLPVGTVLFTSRAGIGNTAILAKSATTNQGFQSIVPKENLLYSYFIYSMTGYLKHYGEVTGAGSTFVEVSGKQMAKCPISLPSLPEQKAIGDFFSTLDRFIALHQRKLEHLKLRKKALLQKMFP
ncbi:restriction endonuclease subunit S [Streptococcus anginosus]|uniref:restriction endonuclease subunit S n=1 Tax=Streptococcus anginosus TaxID=1328 RepID=UPI0022E3D02D|nr:restriction endonuclease subunit S [Streptococcus anginosus]